MAFLTVSGIAASLLVVGCDDSANRSPYADEASPQGDTRPVGGSGQESPEPQAPVPSTQVLATPAQGGVAAAAVTFRIAAAKGMDRALAPVLSSSGSAAAWLTKFGQARYKHLWPFFFSGSMITPGRPQGTALVLAFYNPYVDAAVVTQWSDSEANPQITQACILLGVDVAGGGNRSSPRWATSGDCLAASLLDGCASFRAAFQNFSVPFVDGKIATETASQINQNFEIVEQRCMAITLELARLGRGSAAAASGTALRTLLDNWKDPTGGRLAVSIPANNPVAPASIVSLGGPLLSRMRPTLFINNTDGAIIVLIDSSQPNRMLVAHFGKAKPVGLLSLVPFSFN